MQIFHIDRHKPSDLDPIYIINVVKELQNNFKLLVIDS